MALKRYIGNAERVAVVVLGESYGTVEHGEALAIPDDLAAKVAWPAENWQDVKRPTKTKKEADK